MLRLQNAACGVPVRSQQNRFRANAIAACVLAEICVIFRIYSKLSLLGKLGLDDYFIMVAGVCLATSFYELRCHVLVSLTRLTDCNDPVSLPSLHTFVT